MCVMPFNKEIDYQEKINKAVAEGNLQRAAILEKQRNAKIEAGFGGGEAQTHNYENHAPGYMPSDFLEKEFERRKAEAKKKEFMEKYQSVMDEKWAKENAASAQSAKGALNLNEYNVASGLSSGAKMQQAGVRSRILGDYIGSVDKSAEEKVTALRKTYASVLGEDPEKAEEQTEDGGKTAVPAEEGGSANAEGGEADTAKNDKARAGGIINAVNAEGSAELRNALNSTEKKFESSAQNYSDTSGAEIQYDPETGEPYYVLNGIRYRVKYEDNPVTGLPITVPDLDNPMDLEEVREEGEKMGHEIEILNPTDNSVIPLDGYWSEERAPECNTDNIGKCIVELKALQGRYDQNQFNIDQSGSGVFTAEDLAEMFEEQKILFKEITERRQWMSKRFTAGEKFKLAATFVGLAGVGALDDANDLLGGAGNLVSASLIAMLTQNPNNRLSQYYIRRADYIWNTDMTDVVEQNIEGEYGERLTEDDRILYGAITFATEVVVAIASGKLKERMLGKNNFVSKLLDSLEKIGIAYDAIKAGVDANKEDGNVVESICDSLQSFFRDIIPGVISEYAKL